MNICVIGTGYVGLVTGTGLADSGNNVICVDIDAAKVKMMQEKKVPIYEPGLETLFERNIRQGRLTFTKDLQTGVKGSDILFLALPTPPGEDGSADLSYVLNVASQIGPMLEKYTIIVNKSTVPVGTADLVRETIAKNAAAGFDVISNPEFLREGFAVEDFMKPNRIVIGTRSEKATKIMGELYAPFVRQGNPIIYMDERSAELTKYAANSFLATKISFMNEIAILCERLGADVDMVRIGIGTDDRIGKRFLFPGIGYGGSCFPKDVKALVKSSADAGYDFQILNAVTHVNHVQVEHLLTKIFSLFGHDLSGKTFGLWGLSFKPDTDDVREAPSFRIIEALLARGASIRAFDPEAMENTRKTWADKIYYAPDAYDAIKDADALVIATEWSVFRSPDFSKISSLISNKIIFDGRNIFTVGKMEELGFAYYSIGRKDLPYQV